MTQSPNYSQVLKPALRKSKLQRMQRIYGYSFLAPTVIFFLIFTVVPLVLAFYLAFTNFNLVDDFSWAGLKNFELAFKDRYFLNSLLNIFIYVVMSVPLGIVCSLLVANLVNTKLKGAKVFRVLYYLPAVTSGVATAFVWKWMYNYSFGLFNTILTTFHLPRVEWLDSQSYLPMFSLALVSIWGGIGGNMLIFLAAFKGISPELYEAAEIDGASGFQRLVRITVPMIAPTMYFILTISLIGAFQLFDAVYLITGGGPLHFTQTPVLRIYNMAFPKFQGGRGSAMSIMLFAVIMVVTFVTQLFVKEDRT